MAIDSTIGHHRLVRMLDGWTDIYGPLHSKLAARIRQLVRDGGLPAGIRLPSERSLAAGLGISRNTVASAFDELRAEGVLASRQGSGTYVSMAASHALVRGDDRLGQYATSPEAHSECIDLRSAALPGLAMVAEEFAKLSAGEVERLLPTHGYLPSGLPELREAVAGYYNGLGLPTTADQILVTSGAQQALRLVASAFLEPGANVLVEEPTFRGAIEVLRSVGARLIPVIPRPGGVAEAGLDAAIRTHRPSLILVQGTVHNPTGEVLPEPTRVVLGRASAATGVPILDDAAPADALVDGELPRPLATFGGDVLTIGSASKAFWGGLRVGWLRADASLITRLTSIKGGEDLGTSMLAQLLTIRLLSRVEEARATRRQQLRDARSLVRRALAEQLPDWEPCPSAGGASLWVRLPTTGATAFAARCERAGVLVLPGPTFSSGNDLDDYLRLAFAADPATVRQGIARLSSVWDSGQH